jgi:hypothetical protein
MRIPEGIELIAIGFKPVRKSGVARGYKSGEARTTTVGSGLSALCQSVVDVTGTSYKATSISYRLDTNLQSGETVCTN